MQSRRWLALGMLLVACAASVPHPWASPGTDTRLILATDSWQVLDAGAVAAVDDAKVRAAVSLLREREWVLLDAEQRVELSAPTACRPPDGTSPYLVRGVAHGGIADFTVVRIDTALGWVVVYQGTYDGENLLFLAALREQLALPIIVHLAAPPTRVFAIGELGGDHLVGRGLRYPRAGKCGASPT